MESSLDGPLVVGCAIKVIKSSWQCCQIRQMNKRDGFSHFRQIFSINWMLDYFWSVWLHQLSRANKNRVDTCLQTTWAGRLMGRNSRPDCGSCGIFMLGRDTSVLHYYLVNYNVWEVAVWHLIYTGYQISNDQSGDGTKAKCTGGNYLASMCSGFHSEDTYCWPARTVWQTGILNQSTSAVDVCSVSLFTFKIIFSSGSII